MHSLIERAEAAPVSPFPPSARDVYFDLFSDQRQSGTLERASQFLSDQLAKAERMESDLPNSPEHLDAWMQAGVEQVGRQYREYLEARQAGGKRRYFRSHAHALYFLKSVAPTKMVDGAWLYGLLPRWQDARFTHLIRTYLEELGEGLTAKNHVTLYKKLLQTQGCERWDDLGDDHYIQGALQLSLAYQADQFLPEVIGFNLGYEQLPLHLLITAYELKELGIDPYYFTLHITVDNADSGHAKKAVEAVFDAMPRVGDRDDFYRRVRRGYNLNLLGASTVSVIESFDLEQEMRDVFARKASIGQYVHSDYRLIAGRTVNDWLSEPEKIAEFVCAMEESGWFKRHQDPENSRFWKLIQSEKAKMFGVFSAYEQQVIHDWIVGDAQDRLAGSLKPVRLSRLPFDVKQRLREEMSGSAAPRDTDFDAEVRALEENLSTDREAMMATLIALMSPALHHTASGLAATRMFNEILD